MMSYYVILLSCCVVLSYLMLFHIFCISLCRVVFRILFARIEGPFFQFPANHGALTSCLCLTVPCLVLSRLYSCVSCCPDSPCPALSSRVCLERIALSWTPLFLTMIALFIILCLILHYCLFFCISSILRIIFQDRNQSKLRPRRPRTSTPSKA